MSLIDDAKPLFQKALDHLAQELVVLRTGRANPALVDNVQVEAYGTVQPLKALGSISTPDARTIQIEPWDASVVKAIESAIVKSDIGIMPTVQGKIIRLPMPMMTDETRQRMVKVVHEKLEDARVAVRGVRDEVKKQAEKAEGGKDEVHRLLEALDKLTKETNASIEELGEKKETEITTI